MGNCVTRCYECKHFDKYYTQGLQKFNTTKFGWCCMKQNHVNIHESCDQYVRRPKRKIRTWAICNCLNRLLTELTEARKMIEIECSENNENESDKM